MTVELNATFVPRSHRRKLERHLRAGWARSMRVSGLLHVAWIHMDPGHLVLAVEFGSVRLERDATVRAACDAEAKALVLMESLNRELEAFLMDYHN